MRALAGIAGADAREDEWGRFVWHYSPWLNARLLWLVADWPDPDASADDLVQVVWARVLRVVATRPNDLAAIWSLPGWLLRIAANEVSRARDARALRWVADDAWGTSTPAPSMPDEEFAATEIADAFDRLLSTATDEDRELLRLRLDEGRSWDEIATAMILTPGACRTRFSRLLRRLRDAR